MIKIYIGLHVKYRLFLSGFNATLVFSTDFRKILKLKKNMKILPVSAEVLNADGRTDGRTHIQTDKTRFFLYLSFRASQVYNI